MRYSLKTVLAIGAIAIVAFAVSANAQPTSPAPSSGTEDKLFAVEIRTGPSWDHTKTPNEQAQFREHSANLRKLRDSGQLVMGARYSDKGLLIFTASSAAEVKALMEQDPSMAAGTFRYEIHDFNVFYSGTLQARPRR